MTFFIVLGVLVLFILLNAIRILREYERAVVFRLGRLIGQKGPGLILLIPLVDRMIRVSLRTIVLDVAPQDVITRDNVSVKVNAVVYFRVMEASRAIVEVEDFLFATSQLSQTTLRSVLGQVELDELLAERERRGKVIAAEGEFQAARKLTDAAEIIAAHPAALQLRFLQTLVEVGAENNTTVVFPVPIDLVKPLLKKHEERA